MKARIGIGIRIGIENKIGTGIGTRFGIGIGIGIKKEGKIRIATGVVVIMGNRIDLGSV